MSATRPPAPRCTRRARHPRRKRSRRHASLGTLSWRIPSLGGRVGARRTHGHAGVPDRGSAVCDSDGDEQRVGPTVIRKGQRSDRRRRDERAVEDDVVDGERPAAVRVVDLLLDDQAVDTNLDALGGDPERNPPTATAGGRVWRARGSAPAGRAMGASQRIDPLLLGDVGHDDWSRESAAMIPMPEMPKYPAGRSGRHRSPTVC